MPLPYFYIAQINADILTLSEETSKHIVQVLRMQVGEKMKLTNGKGLVATAVIEDDNRKRCAVRVIEKSSDVPMGRKVTVAISLIKNASRFEWFLEKATEIGVTEIIPLLCDRTEKEKFRHDRLNAILISAMLQSQQSWLPLLHEPVSFSKVLQLPLERKFIAHCDEGHKQQLSREQIDLSAHQLILIGPEGDFTENEIRAALEKGFKPVALGNTRLRTETAGIVAAALLCNEAEAH